MGPTVDRTQQTVLVPVTQEMLRTVPVPFRGPGIVEHDVDVEVSRDIEVGQLEEGEDISSDMPLTPPMDELTGADAQGGDEVTCAVAPAGLRQCPGASRLHRKTRLAAAIRLLPVGIVRCPFQSP